MYLGIDPGKSGGVAVVNAEGGMAWKIPDTERDLRL